MKTPICKHCNKEGHYQTFCPNKPRKPIKPKVVEMSLDEYQEKKKSKLSGAQKHGSVSQLLKIATDKFNAFIRHRDAIGQYFTCISCSLFKHVRFMQAGHYMPSTYSQLKFNELNVNAECIQCNCMDENHLVGYRKNLIRKIGIEKVEELENSKIGNTAKWDREELLEIIKKYKI